MGEATLYLDPADHTLWRTGVLCTWSADGHLVHELARVKLLTELHRQAPQLDASALADRIAALGVPAEGGPSAAGSELGDVLRLFRRAAAAGADEPALRTAARAAVAWAFEPINTSSLPIFDGQSPLYAGYVLDQGAHASGPDVLGEAVELAKADATFSEAFDRTFSAGGSIARTDTLSVQSDHPDWYPPLLDPLINDDGSADVSLDELMALADEVMKKVSDGNETARTVLQAVAEMQPDPLAVAGKGGSDADLEAAKKEIKAIAAEADKVQKAGNFIAEVIGKIGGEDAQIASKGVKTLVDTGVKITKSYASYVAEAGTFAAAIAVNPLGAVGLLFDVGQAVLGISGLFGDDEQNANQKILEAIRALRNDIAAMRGDMKQRFDKIDKSLNQLARQIADGFNKINLELGRIDGKIDTLQEELVAAMRELTHVEAAIRGYVTVSSREPLVERVNYGVHYKQHANADLSDERFIELANTYYTWAVDDSRNPLEEPVDGRAKELASVATQLESPWDQNVMYLAHWADRNLDTDAWPREAQLLPNPLTWATAAGAYADIQLDWPDLAAAHTTQRRRAEVRAAGEELNASLRAITVVKGDPATPNARLFPGLVAAYRACADAIFGDGQAISRVERDTAPASGLDPWGGPNQAGAKLPDGLATVSMPDTGAALPAPAIANCPPEYAVAAALGVTKLAISCSSEWRDVREQPINDTYSEFYGWPLVTLTASCDGAAIFENVVRGPEQLITTGGPGAYSGGGDPSPAVRAGWDNDPGYKEKAGGSWTPASGEQEARAAAAVAAQKSLLGLQADAYAAIAKQLRAGEPAAPYADELAGVKALIAAFVGLGLPRALASDDLLRALLYGSISLIDGQAVRDAYAGDKPAAGRANLRVRLRDEAERGIAAFAKVIGAYTARLASDGWDQAHPLIELTLAKLELAEAFAAKAPAGSPT
jgi:hypothetical protein